MDPQLAIILGTALVKYGPDVARAVAGLFQKNDPTWEEWEAVFALAEKSYDDYVRPTAPATPTP